MKLLAKAILQILPGVLLLGIPIAVVLYWCMSHPVIAISLMVLALSPLILAIGFSFLSQGYKTLDSLREQATKDKEAHS